MTSIFYCWLFCYLSEKGENREYHRLAQSSKVIWKQRQRDSGGEEPPGKFSTSPKPATPARRSAVSHSLRDNVSQTLGHSPGTRFGRKELLGKDFSLNLIELYFH